MRKLRKSTKIEGRHNEYTINGCGLQYCTKFAGKYLAIIEHKKRPSVVLIENKHGDRNFENINVINASEARAVIGWLARFIALVDPDPISLSIAASKTHANMIVKEQTKIAQELGLK